MSFDKIDYNSIKEGLFEELFYGTIAGITICIIGHPFDTLKTRLQINPQKLNILIKNIIQKEGYFAFYKGLSSPLYSIPLLNAIVFGSYSISKQFFETNNEFFNFTDKQIIGLSGIICGILNSPFVTPIELFKIKLQIQQKEKYYTSNFDIFKKLKNVSGFKGIFQGYYSTISREIISYPSQFLTYEIFLEYFRRNNQDLFFYHYMFSGGMAGTACWTSSYAIDVIKTKIQSERLKKSISIFPNGNFLKIAKNIYQKDGIKGYFAGLTAIFGRAFFANGCGFLAWELAKQNFKISHNKQQISIKQLNKIFIFLQQNSFFITMMIFMFFR